MCNGFLLKSWQADSIQSLIDMGCEPSLLVVNRTATGRSPLGKRLSVILSSNFLYRMYLRFFQKVPCNEEKELPVDIRKIPAIECQVSRKGHSEFFANEDVERIKSHDLDFILRFGFNIIRGDILETTRYGIWSFHHGDEQKYRGGPPAFWEVYQNNKVTGVVLQKLTNMLDGGIILKKGFYKTLTHSWNATLNQVLSESAHWPAQVVKSILFGEIVPENMEESNTSAPVYKAPVNRQMAWFLFVLMTRILGFHLKQLFSAELWNVGFVHKHPSELIQSKLSKDDITWLKKPRPHHFYADPFVYKHDNRITVLYEDFNYKKFKGSINYQVFDAKSRRLSETDTLLKRDYHLAYPYLIRAENELFFVPESADSGRIDLYKITPVSREVTFVRTLLEIEGVDPTLFHHNNKWWLFFTRKQSSNTHLYVYYADKIDADFKPHGNNPVKTDIRSARPAGNLFYFNRKWVRPAQDCSVRYGRKIVFNEIVRLDEEIFNEKILGELTMPENSKYNKGLHTISFDDEITVVDAKRYVFNIYNLIYQLRKSLKKRL